MSSSNYYEQPLITYIKLTKRLVNNSTDPDSILPGELASTYIEIYATDESDEPLDIFVYQVEPIDYDAPDDFAALFSNVCSPNDWQELPIGVPTDPETLLFRHSNIKAVCRSLAEANVLWDAVKSDVDSLIRLHKALLNPPSTSNIQSDTHISE